MATTTIAPTKVEKLARQLAAKTPLTASVSAKDATAAAAFLLAKAGAAVSALRPQGQSTLEALDALDKLTHGAAGATGLWLALRALSLRAGDAVGVPAALAGNLVLDALVGASGLVMAVDASETVAGAFGTAWVGDKLRAPGRTVALKAGLMTLRCGNETLAKLDVGTDPRGALARVDALMERAATAKGGPAPVVYTARTEAVMEIFAAEVFAPYGVRRVAFEGVKAHPTPLVESATLASVMPPVPTYKPLVLPSVLAKGALSDVQLESIVYAGESHGKFLPSHPNDANLPAPRQGFLIGHGTGVGKGRILAGIIADNWAQGRQRSVWISESGHLVKAARADWVALGGRADDVWDAREMPSGQPLPSASGVLFITYAGLRSENGMGRVNQIIDWMGQDDGVVAFDEAQNLRNTMPTPKGDGWNVGASAQATAARDLQDRMPRARVVYASATTASDIVGLTYAHRLGLWGETSAFANAERFVAAMTEGGTNALEMVARDMKAMGLYLAANLSFEGVKYERLEHRMSAAERNQHDAMSAMWLTVSQKLKRAILTTGIQTGPATAVTRDHKRPDLLFNMARARFFQATIAAMKTPMIIKAIRQDIIDGHSALVQLSNTFEANADRAIRAAEEAGLGMDAVAVTPRDILLDYLQKGFPVHLWENARTAKGGTVIQPKRDANGVHMICPQAVAERDRLIAEVNATPIPEGPLEQLLDAFGPEMVAEATGRSRRLVPGPHGRVLEERAPDATPKDIEAFMNGTKRILVFSGAGATGQTYSAARTCANRRMRRHYVLQPGWRADLAIQGMGRSHRSDQDSPPEYVLASIDLWADQRMVSRVARGMRDLGALTRGQRQAASQDFFTQDDNLEGDFGQEAWGRFVQKLADGQFQSLSIGQFEKEANLDLRLPSGITLTGSNLPPVHRFLNAMAAMSCDSQAIFGRALREELIALRAEAVAQGTYDRGVETIRPDALIKLDDVVIYRDARTGGETRLLKMLRVDRIEPMAFQQARADALMRGNALVAKSLVTGRVAIVCFPRSLRELAPSATDRVMVYTPTGMRERTRAEVVAEGWNRAETNEAAAMWDAEKLERGAEEDRMFWVASGVLLPLWDKLPKGRPTVYRMETDDGEQIIGRLVPDDFVEKLLTRVDALVSGGLPAADVQAALEKGGVVSLANGWMLQGRVYKDKRRDPSITLFLPEKEEAGVLRLRSKGLDAVRGGYPDEVAYRLPEGTKRPSALAALLAIAPAVQVVAF